MTDDSFLSLYPEFDNFSFFFFHNANSMAIPKITVHGSQMVESGFL